MTTFRIGGGNQSLACIIRVAALTHDARDVSGAQMRRQAVAAHHQRVAAREWLLCEVGTDRAVGTERLQDDVAAFTHFGLIGGHLAGLDQLLHQRLILRDLLRRAIAHDVRATVADLRQIERVAEQSGDRSGRAHARMLRVRAGVSEDAVIRGVGRIANRFHERVGVASHVVHPLRAERIEHRFDRHRARDFAGCGAAHAVRHHQHHSTHPDIDHAILHVLMSLPCCEVEVGERVLVVVARDADISPTGEPQSHAGAWHRRLGRRGVGHDGHCRRVKRVKPAHLPRVRPLRT